MKLYYGDCLELMKEIDDKSIDMICCDLPYGETNNEEDVIIPFDELWKYYKRIIKDNGAIVLFAQGLFYVDLVNSNREWYRYDLVWDKILVSDFLNANVKPLRVHEQIAILDNRCGETQKYPTTVITCQKPHPSIAKHRTEKPIKLLEYLIKTYSNEGNLILDNCMGSGSTGIACYNTNRHFIGIEKDEKYFNLAKERIDNAMAQLKLF